MKEIQISITKNVKRDFALLSIGFSIIFTFLCASQTFGQDYDKYNPCINCYTVTGRVVDAVGKPVSNAGVWIEPVTNAPAQLDSFIVGVGTDAEGRFTKQIEKTKFSVGRTYFVFVTVDTHLEALTTIDPPFRGIRKHDKSFDGKPIKLGSKELIDVGDVKVQFWYGQANLNFADYFKTKHINSQEWDWRGFYILVRNEKGFLVYFSNISIDGVKNYVDPVKGTVRISLPEGKWKVEIVEDYPIPKIAETRYFEIKRGEIPKEITIISARPQP